MSQFVITYVCMLPKVTSWDDTPIMAGDSKTVLQFLSQLSWLVRWGHDLFARVNKMVILQIHACENKNIA